ncbi:MAG TPA: lytic transglycosylase domain-containing protein [Ktedonobacterales bacterium]|jgi:hypothetical protein
MSAAPLSPQGWPGQQARKRPSCLWLGLFAIGVTLLGSVLAAVVLLRQLAPFSLLAPLPDGASFPTTSPGFALSGQATCHTTTPPTTSRWLAVAISEAERNQIDTAVFAWQIWQESRFDPDAVSPAGAIGIAQFEPETAAELGINPRDPSQAPAAAARLDAQRIGQYAQRARLLADHFGGASARYAYGLMLAAYNAGAGAVEGAWTRSFSWFGLPLWPSDAWNWLSHLGRETRNYVPAILGCL